MSASSGLSPQILLGKIANSLRVMAGRQPLAGSFGADAAALWQAIGAGMIFTFLVYLKVKLYEIEGTKFPTTEKRIASVFTGAPIIGRSSVCLK